MTSKLFSYHINTLLSQ